MKEEVTMEEFYYPSSDGIHQIHGVEWKPEKTVVGILQICHGMGEHMGRYQEFAKYMANNGYYVVGAEHLGHGKSVNSRDELGYFHETNGNDYVISDIHQLHVKTKEKYPQVPYFMLGHSMGSFLLRQYLGLHGAKVTGAIIMGTGDKSILMLQAGKTLCKFLAKTKGWYYRSKFIDGLAVGAYRKKYGPEWLSKDLEHIGRYKDDPLCGFMFTVNGYYQMFTGMIRMNKQERLCKTLKELPLFFVAGKEDPVGDKGIAVQNVYNRYKKCGYQDVEIKLYEGDRHEILNETDRDRVYEDIRLWLEARNKFLSID